MTGLSFYTAQPLERDSMIVQVPRELCITSSSALEATQLILTSITGSSSVLQPDSLPAPDWILLYLVLSRLAEEFLAIAGESGPPDDIADLFEHLPYVSHIPKSIETPLHFSPAELALLTNTPLFGSTERRLRETIVDYQRALSLITGALVQSTTRHPFALHLLTALQPVSIALPQDDVFMAQTYHKGLELWRWAESAFTSRSFPPRLVGLSDARESGPSSNTAASAPILIPAYDTFNHARAHPVTWSFSPTSDTEPGLGKVEEGMVGLTINYHLPAVPCQVFNNYGGKSNEEFLSGYGFTLDTLTEDTLALKLGSETDSQQGTTHYWIIPPNTPSAPSTKEGQSHPAEFVRAPCPCPSLLSELEHRVLHGEPPPSSNDEQLELYASVLETLESLLLTKRKAFRASQARVDSLAAHLDATATYTEHNRPKGWHRSPDAADINSAPAIRPSVYTNVLQYRAGQLHLLNHAVGWTRTELERVADALDQLDLV